jgi:acid phosphatase (class A)
MGSFTLAIVLGEIFPDKKQAFLARAAEIAQSRVDAGVHNPSDIAEGEVLGRATGAAILASPAFQADLVEVEAELKK